MISLEQSPFKFVIVLISLFCLGCEPETEEVSNGSQYTPWINQFVSGWLKVNGIDKVGHEISTTHNHLKNYVCYQHLPDGSINSMSSRIYVPSHPEPGFQSGIDKPVPVIFYNDRNTGDIGFQNTFLEKVTWDGMTYSVFLIEGRYSGSDINKDNFQQFRVDFDIIYHNSNDEEIHRSSKSIVVNNQYCDFLDEN